MRYFTSMVTLALALTFAACSQDAAEESVPEAPGNVHITLSAPFNATESRAPQSAEYTAEIDKTRELIESYYVVFTQGDGESEHVVKVVKDANVTSGGEGIESKRLDLELRPGDYRVYAFANIPESYLDGLTFKKSVLASASYLLTDDILTPAAVGAGKHAEGRAFFPVEDIAKIPMTSINGQEIHVTERTSQTFGIEVVRMLGKVQFDFRNPTDKALLINGIKMSDLTINQSSVDPASAGATMLMNYIGRYADHEHGFLGQGVTLPPGARTKALNADYTGSPLALAANSDPEDYDKANDGTATASFYVLESKSRDAVGNSFDLDFDITPTSGGPYTDNVRYAITKPNNFTAIHRNDWIVIPVSIGEWVMSLTAFSYPPIGGYPEARVDADKSGNFHVSFATPGDIAFLPVIHKYYSTTDYFYLNDPVRIVGSVTPIVSDPSNIFSSAPTLDPFSGEIVAALSDVKGAATITLNVNFKKLLSPVTPGTLTSKIVIERI